MAHRKKSIHSIDSQRGKALPWYPRLSFSSIYLSLFHRPGYRAARSSGINSISNLLSNLCPSLFRPLPTGKSTAHMGQGCSLSNIFEPLFETSLMFFLLFLPFIFLFLLQHTIFRPFD